MRARRAGRLEGKTKQNKQPSGSVMEPRRRVATDTEGHGVVPAPAPASAVGATLLTVKAKVAVLTKAGEPLSVAVMVTVCESSGPSEGV
jgi:hypothetical protein